MLIYWLMYLYPVIMVFVIKYRHQSSIILLSLFGLFFILIIGFRSEVGCDWYNYMKHYESTVGVSFSQAFTTIKDPAHTLVNWSIGQLSLGIYTVNLIYASIFVIGLIQFSRTQTYVWLALAVAVPYMIIMVSMGYSRQGIALGLFMWAISYLEKGKFKKYIFLVLVAAAFHKTALILLPFGLFLSKGGMLLRFIIMIPVFYGAWELLLAERQEALWQTYIEEQMQSSGAKIRVVMNLIPAILLLIYRKKWREHYLDYPFWFWISIASIISVGMVSFATTAVDRMALYFIPLQVAVYSRLPFLANKQISPNITKILILIGYAIVLFVWLLFATHAHCWLPYKNIIFEGIL